MQKIINKYKNLSEDKTKLISNFISLNVLQIIDLILPLVTLPYLIRVLTPENFGQIMFAQSLILFFVIFLDYGFNYSATRSISINRENKEKVNEIFISVMQIKFLYLVISFVFLYLIVNYFEKFHENQELYYLTFLYAFGQILFPVWYFQGKEDMKYITYLNLIAKLIFTVLIFVLVNEKEDFLYVPILNGTGYIVAGVLSLYLIFTKYDEQLKFYNFNVLIKYISDSTDFFLSRLFVSIYTISNVFILGLVTSNTIVGYYAIAEKLYSALKSLYLPLSRVLYPYIANERNINLYKKIFYLVIVLNIFIVSISIVFSPYIIELIAGEYIKDSVTLLQLFLIISLYVVPSALIGYSFLAALGYKNYANNSVIFASCIHIVVLILLYYTSSINMFTIIYALAFTEMIVFSIRFYGVYKHKLWNIRK